MREILFRGKREDNGEWVCGGSIIRFNKEQGEDCDLVFMPQYDEKCLCTHDANDNIIAWGKTMFYKIDPSTVGQYTGLTDKNGKRIFEGDILRFFTGTLYIVVWEYHRWLVRVCGEPDVYPDDLDEFFCERADVTGNIHDNPELLGGGGATNRDATSSGPACHLPLKGKALEGGQPVTAPTEDCDGRD